jgi:toxin HigB-1
MRLLFASKKLEQLYLHGKGAQKIPLAVYQSFLGVVDTLRVIPDERSLYTFPGLRMEKLRGERSGQHSLRLNDQYRLCFEIIKDPEGNILCLIEIVDYH